MSFHKLVAKIQTDLKAPKNQQNTFGKYSYRSCEDILEAVKKVKGDLVLTVNDDIQVIGDRVYVKSTATITDGEHSISNSAFAREPLSKKGMDESQITGAASSYARKYALNGLFCIDDNKDADTNEHRNQSDTAPFQPTPEMQKYAAPLNKNIESNTPIEFYYYMEKSRGYGDDFYFWLNGQMAKGLKSKGKALHKDGSAQFKAVMQVMTEGSESERSEAWGELTPAEHEIINKALEKRKAA